jgi:glycosyltransferase involved in cell wall biosynthesis
VADAISVLMPAYNSESTIRLAVKSALFAVGIDSEVLVFLDGCSDKTLQVLQEISDPRLKVHVSKANVGVVKARQFLFEWASNDLVAVLDSDDIALPWRFASQARVLKRNSADFVFGNAILFGSALKPLGFIPQWPVGLNSRQVNLSLIFTNPLVNSAMLAKKSSIEAIGGFKGSIEDLGMWLEASAVGLKIVKTAGYAVFYRVHPTQLSRTPKWKAALANDPLLMSVRELHNKLLSTGVAGQDAEEIHFNLWREYALGSFGLMMQNIGLKDYLRYLFTGLLRDQNGGYRHTRHSGAANSHG